MASASTFELLLRLALSLGVVIGLMVLLAAGLRRRGLQLGTGRPAPGVRVEVLARRGLGRSASIAVVRAAGKSMVLGVTDAAITMLAEADLDEIDLDESGPQWTGPAGGGTSPGSTWKALLETLRERTTRRS